jgi:excisionase family DNA binding protein
VDTQPQNGRLAGVGDSTGLLLSVPQAAAHLGIGIWALRGLIADKRLPVVKVGRAFYLRRATLAKWAEGAERFVRG